MSFSLHIALCKVSGFLRLSADVYATANIEIAEKYSIEQIYQRIYSQQIILRKDIKLALFKVNHGSYMYAKCIHLFVGYPYITLSPSLIYIYTHTVYKLSA